MAINFPNATQIGQIFTDPTSGNTYICSSLGPPAEWTSSSANTDLSATYLRVDASNSPVTGNLKVGGTAAAPNIELNANGTANLNGVTTVGGTTDPSVYLFGNGTLANDAAAIAQFGDTLSGSPINRVRIAPSGLYVGNGLGSGSGVVMGHRIRIAGSGTTRIYSTGYTGSETPSIELNSDGSALFAGGTTEVHPSGQIFVQRNDGNNTLGVFDGKNSSGLSTTRLLADGTVQAVNTTIQPISSERRLKENIVAVDAAASWSTIKNTPYYAYNFIGVETVNYGPMADEVPDEMRVATDRSDDVGTIHTYDNGMLQARLYTALQTALTRIETLESEVAALKGA